LFAWLVASVALGTALSSLRPKRWTLPLAAAALALLSRPWLVEREPFVDRREHLQIGAAARERADAGRLVIDVGDYGYFAVIAGFTAPERAHGVLVSDPRHTGLKLPTAPLQLQHEVRVHDAAWVVVDRVRFGSESWLDRAVFSTPSLALLPAAALFPSASPQ
jgi:hypothetical protein